VGTPRGESVPGNGREEVRGMATAQSKAAGTVRRADTAPVLLRPGNVRAMIAERQKFQVIKFRTTCSDCVPNL